MTTTMQDKRTRTRNYCPGAELLWDQSGAEMFRKICQDAFGRDCFCQDGEDCWLTEAGLKGLQEQVERMTAATV